MKTLLIKIIFQLGVLSCFCYVNLNSNNVEIGRWQNGKKQYKTLWVNLTFMSVFFTQLTGIVFTLIWSKISMPLLHPLESFATLWTHKWFTVTVFVLVWSKISGVRVWIRTLITLVLFLVVGYQMCVSSDSPLKHFPQLEHHIQMHCTSAPLNIWMIASDPLASLTSCYRREEHLTSSSNTLYSSSLEHWTDYVRIY